MTEKHDTEVKDFLQRLEMGGNVDGISMDNADDNHELSTCVKDGILALV